MNPVEWYRGASDWVSGSERPQAGAPPVEAGTGFPSLREVPERPRVLAPNERTDIVDGLIGDRENARHTQERLNRQGTPSRPLAPRQQPAAQPAPAAEEGPRAAVEPSAAPVLGAPLVEQEAPRPVAVAAAPAPAPTPAPVAPPAPVMAAPPPAPAIAAPAPAIAAPPPAPVVAAPPPAPVVAVATPPAPPVEVAPLPAPPPVEPVPAALAEPVAAPVAAPIPITVAPAEIQAPPAAVAASPQPQAAPSSGNLLEDVYRRRLAEYAAQNAPAEPVPLAVPAMPVLQAAMMPVGPQLVGSIGFAGRGVRLPAEGLAQLQEVARRHKERGGSVRVVGFAGGAAATLDPVKAMLDELDIAIRRADVVTRELVRLGVPAKAISTGTAEAPPATGATEIYIDY